MVDSPRVVIERRLGALVCVLVGGRGPKRSTKDDRLRPGAGGESLEVLSEDILDDGFRWRKVSGIGVEDGM